MLSRVSASLPKATAIRSFSTINAPVTQTTALNNGFRVASEDGVGETATIGVFVNTGSRYETEANNGVAHFLEHLSFKGTKSRTQMQLEKEIENMGGHLNAYTSREHTVFSAKVFKEDVPKAVELLSDILQNSELSESAVEAEKNVIIREGEEIATKPFEVLFDHLHSTAYQDTALGRTILGPNENVRKMTSGDLRAYIDNHYKADRMVLAGAGAVSHQQLCELADKHFGGLKASTAADTVPEPAVFTGADTRIEDSMFTDTHMAIAWEGPGWTSPDTIPLMFMQSMIGQWDHTALCGKNLPSQLCRTAAQENLCYSLQAFNTTYTDTSLFGVYAVSNPAKLEDLAYEVMNEWVRMCFKVTDAEVARTRQSLKAGLMMALDDTSSVCDDIGRQTLVYGRRISPEEMCARFDAVTPKAIMDAASTYVYDRDVAVVSLGPGSRMDLPDYNKLRRWTYWLRY